MPVDNSTNYAEFTVQLMTGLTALVILLFQQMERARNHRHRLKEEEYKYEQEKYREKLAIDLEFAKRAAALAATQTVKLKQEVIESKKERTKQIGEVKDLLSENTAMNKSALDASNGFTNKIHALGMEIREKDRSVENINIEAENVTVISPEHDKPTEQA